MSDSNAPRDPFPGFRLPTTTQVPDEVFDVLMPTLSGAELKVLLYICRRTFGFRKASDSISISQLTSGITTRDGRVLDSGTGLARHSVVNALRSLAEQGIIIATRHSSRERGDETTTYELRFVAGVDPQCKKNTGPSAVSTPAPVLKLHSQQTVLQQTVEQETDVSNIRPAPPTANLRSPGELSRNGATAVPATRELESSATEALSSASVTSESSAPAKVAAPEPPAEVEYNEARRLILAYVTDFARELGDRASLRSSTTRATNILRASGRSLDDFTELMLQARAQTQERSAAIRSARIPGEKRVRMAYFFACLARLASAGGPRPATRSTSAEPAP